VLKAAGELGAAEGLAGVCAISPPIELAQASSAIDRGLVNAVYQESFLRSLRALVAEKARAHPGRYDPRDLAEVRSLRDFDDRFIAPCFGFRDADDYYARGSAGPWLPKIRVPTLVVHARDDSIIPFRPFEHWIAAGLPNVRFLTPARGGHVGFVSARPARNEHWRDADLGWAENRIVQFVAWLERARTR